MMMGIVMAAEVAVSILAFVFRAKVCTVYRSLLALVERSCLAFEHPLSPRISFAAARRDPIGTHGRRARPDHRQAREHVQPVLPVAAIRRTHE